MMQRELADWPGSMVGETWEAMRHYLLGSPHGSRSSLFVDQDTALAMKRIYTAMNEPGMSGPMRQRYAVAQILSFAIVGFSPLAAGRAKGHADCPEPC